MKFKLILLCVLCSLPFLANASAGTRYEACFDTAAQKFGLDKTLLKAIAHTESRFNEYAISPPNANGTYDIGIMQINSSWLPTLSKYGISREKLQSPCANIHVGAWVLANNISTFGKTWRAVGAYNSPTGYYQVRYVKKVQQSYAMLSNQGE